MSKLPLVMPDYKIILNSEPPFECKWEELLGWFIVPKPGEKLSWALYEIPKRKKCSEYKMEFTGRAAVHGVVGIVTEQYLDSNGRTVLWRRFNRDDWRIDYYKQKWSDKLPNNERLSVNKELYVHWYDCVTEYIM